MKVNNKLEDLKGVQNIICTVGSFDGVHIGHQSIIKRMNKLAKENAGSSLLISFDPHPRVITSQRPELLCCYEEKIEVLKQHNLDYHLILPFNKEFSQMEARDFVTLLNDKLDIHTFLSGYGNSFGAKGAGNFDLLKQMANELNFDAEEIEVVKLNDLVSSSTLIREMINKSDFTTANSLLGRLYSIRSKVYHGDKIGRDLGFPTANVSILCADKLVPKEGVYVVDVKLESGIYRGMLNIGTRPSFGFTEPRIEVHIIDFNDDIYGECIEVMFLGRLREEKKFEGIEKLIKQLHIDKEDARNYKG